MTGHSGDVSIIYSAQNSQYCDHFYQQIKTYVYSFFKYKTFITIISTQILNIYTLLEHTQNYCQLYLKRYRGNGSKRQIFILSDNGDNMFLFC